jgi:hypothetical protein
MSEQSDDAAKPPAVRIVGGSTIDGPDINAGHNGPRPKELEMKQRPATPSPPKKDK